MSDDKKKTAKAAPAPITATIECKIVGVRNLGNGSTDVDVALSMDGKDLGAHTYRVNRTGKEAEEIALGLGRMERGK
jgi:hypothetical protein